MKKLILVALAALVLSPNAHASKGGGGGDSYTLDFISIAQRQLFPWLAKNGGQLKPSVDAVKFIAALDFKKIVSVDHASESCDGTNRGREVEACFDNVSGNIYLSRARYLIAAPESDKAKIALVAHEIFRKMGIEGDDYGVSTQMLALMRPVVSLTNTHGKWTCVSQISAIIERNAVDQDHNSQKCAGWIPLNGDYFATSPTKVQALQSLKNVCMRGYTDEGWLFATIRPASSTVPNTCINPNLDGPALIKSNSEVCNQILSKFTVCEQQL